MESKKDALSIIAFALWNNSPTPELDGSEPAGFLKGLVLPFDIGYCVGY